MSTPRRGRRRTLLVLAAVVVVFLVLAGLVSVLGGQDGDGSGTGTPRAGSTRLPDVTLESLRPGDRSIDLGSLKGPAVVNLWANWCGPCRKELPFYESFHRSEPGVRVIGVNWRDPQHAAALRLARSSGVTYPLVVDPGEHFTAQGLPRLLLVDGSGKVVYAEYVQIKSAAQLRRLVSRHLDVRS